MELAIEEDYTARQSQAYSSLNRLFSADFDPKLIYETIEMTRNSAGDAKASIWERLSYLANTAIQLFHVIPSNPTSFTDMCTAGQFALSLFGLNLGTKSSNEDIILQQRQGVLFLLYTTFTFDSFVDFPCGHFALKYEYYRQLQGRLGAKTASCGEIAAMELGCWCCNYDVSEAISRSCAGFEPLPMVSPVNPVAKCGLCQRDYEEKLPGLCPEHDICPTCAIKTYVTACYDCNPCCKTKRSRSDLLMLRNAVKTRFAGLIPLLTMVKHDKKVENSEAYAQKCKTCDKQYVFEASHSICEKCVLSQQANRQKFTGKSMDRAASQQPASMSKLPPASALSTTAAETRARQGQLAHPGKQHKTPNSTADLAKSSPGDGTCAGVPSMNRSNSAQEPLPDNYNAAVRIEGEFTLNRPASVAMPGVGMRKGSDSQKGIHGGDEERKTPAEERKEGEGQWATRIQRVEIQSEIENEEGMSNQDLHRLRAKCTICQTKYSQEDEAYFCPGACRCRRCVIEAMVDVSSSNVCKLCHHPFQPNVFRLTNAGRKRCHVCGIAVDQGEMEKSANCAICIKCVVVSSTMEWLFIPTLKGSCRIHSKSFSIDTEYYNAVKTRDPYSACCAFNHLEGKRLKCGHYVCRTHKEHLRFCRACQAPVEQPLPHQS